MQSAICLDDTPATVSLTPPLVALLLSVLVHALLLWTFQGDFGQPVAQMRNAGTIAVRLLRSAPDSHADSGRPAAAEATPQSAVAGPPAPAAVTRPADQARPRTVKLTPAPVVAPPRNKPPPVTRSDARAQRRARPPATAVPAKRPSVQPVQRRRAAQQPLTVNRAAAGADTPATSSGSADPPSARAAGFSIVPIHAPQPVYPMLARRLGMEGVVTLRITVAAGGAADRVEVLASSGHKIFDRAAVDAVRNWRFRVSGVPEMPSASSIDVPIRFKLNRR